MGEQAFFLDDDLKTSINFNLTDEGLIIDAFDGTGEPLYTEAKTALEWFHWMAEQAELRELREMYGKSHPDLVMRRTRNLVAEMPQISYGPTAREGFWTVTLDGINTLGYFKGDDAEELAKDTATRVAEAIGAEKPVRDMSSWRR